MTDSVEYFFRGCSEGFLTNPIVYAEKLIRQFRLCSARRRKDTRTSENPKGQVAGRCPFTGSLSRDT